MPGTQVWQLSTGELRASYERRELSPREAVAALIEHIERHDASIGAFTTPTFERALADAADLTDELAAGESRGALHGVPVGIKELFDVGGAETTYGSPMLAGRIPQHDAEAVRRLRAAGCIVMGLTRSHEFGWGITTQNERLGSTVNPWSTDRVPGGSSGGSAAALAMGFVPVALGSDTGGSIRIPAAFCGVAGFKPTYGRVSKRGAVALAPSLDHPGPLARDVAGLVAAIGALSGYDGADPTTLTSDLVLDGAGDGLAGLVVGVCPDLHVRPLWPDHQRVFDRSVAVVESAGARVIEVAFPDAAAIRPAFGVIQMAEAHDYHAVALGLYPGRRDEYGGDVAHRLDMASEVTLGSYLDARRRAATFDRRFQQIFESVDVVLTPVTGGGPSTTSRPDVVVANGEVVPFRDLVMDYTVPQDLAGLPTCAVPVGRDGDGIPVAVQLTAGFGRDATALRAGCGLEGGSDGSTRMAGGARR
jgi:aspartyl-tRNA(Asn)/glutamyl-tRNA(Gln) amidotransferase subunit A